MHVEHEIDQRALQLGAQVPIEGETRAGDFGGALQIKDAEFGAQIPMGFGLEIEARRIADAADLDVIGRIFAYRDGFVRNIGNAGQEILKFRVHGFHLLIQRGDLGFQSTDLFLLPAGIGAFAA